ncbi:MAG: hypothetical protein JNM53_12150 [Gemmatimonadetes bacterium]|nr:hypothetical protein [Gemmatimonadota bacterium]
MNDDERDAMIRRLAHDSLQPPPAPREEIWRRIEMERKAAVPAVATVPTVARMPVRWGRVLVPLALAATLALAFGLGRMTAPPPPSDHAAESPSRRAAEASSTAHRLVAAEYLGRTEVFLTDFRAAASTGQPDETASREARRLLGTARLLLDSPAAEDVRLRALLEDLELVLAEIAQLQRERREDLNLITDGLDQRGTLGRLRAAVPAGGTPASTQGVL